MIVFMLLARRAVLVLVLFDAVTEDALRLADVRGVAVTFRTLKSIDDK